MCLIWRYFFFCFSPPSPPALQVDVEGGERLQAQQIVHDPRGVRVMRPVVELLYHPGRVLEILVPATTKRETRTQPTRKHDGFVLSFSIKMYFY